MFVFIVLTTQCLEIKSIIRVTLTSKHTDVFLLCKFHLCQHKEAMVGSTSVLWARL